MSSKTWRRWPWALALGLFGWLAGPERSVAQVGPETADCDPTRIAAQIEVPALDLAGAVRLRGLRLNAGLASLILDGMLIPATAIAGRPAEMVFLGKGRVEFSAPDETEAGQLDLFTGSRRLDEEFDQAVLVLALDPAVDALFSRPKSTLDPAQIETARTAYAAWLRAAERKILNVSGSLLRDACGDPVSRGFVAARLHTANFGELLLVVDPEEREQFTLGRFVPLDATEREKRKLRRVLDREQRRGRLIGVDLEDLGQFDTWISAALRVGGQPHEGLAAFEPSRYVIDATIDDRRLSATVRIEMRRQTLGARSLAIRLSRTYKVIAVRDEGGAALPFQRSGDEIAIVLPRAVAEAPTAVVVVEYEAGELEREGRALYLSNTESWYPQTGNVNRARYEATFHWPRRLQLLAPGKRVDHGESGDRRWERRVVDRETFVYTFEIGRFDIDEVVAGSTTVRFAFDPEGRALGKDVRQEIRDSVVGSLAYFGELFGPLPYDELTVVTSPREFSQSTFGFVTLSNAMMSDFWGLNAVLGIEDRRTVVAHEVAHQWWGHQVAWDSDRDQWLSEALASYSAVRYRREKLVVRKGDKADKPVKEFRIGPTWGWREALTSELASGRPVESVGPLVLGRRLSSSLSGDAYEAIVYRKGAVVLDMLARGLGEKVFTDGLRVLSGAVAGRALSTAGFFDAFERISGVSLEAFEARFVRGTGLPDVFYDYRFEPVAEGGWRVTGEARLVRPYHYRYRVERLADGFDVRRQRQSGIETLDDLALAVPVQITFYDPARDERKGSRRAEPEPNAVARTHVLISGEVVKLDFQIPQEPLRFWLDQDAEVYGRFFDEKRYPKRMALYRAWEKAAADDPAAADLLTRALVAPVFAGDPDEPDQPKRSALANEGRALDSWIHLTRARLALDGGRIPEAASALDAAQALLRGANRATLDERLLLENRLRLRRGESTQAFEDLRRAILRRKELDGPEAQALLAAAAAMVGRVEERDKAIEEARKQNVDVSAFAEQP